MNINSGKFDSIKAEALVAHLLAAADGLRFGSVSLSAKLHEGRVVEVLFSRTENTRDVEVKKEPGV